MLTSLGYRKRVKRWEHGIRFLTFSCEKRLPLLRHPAIADLFVAELQAARLEYRFELYAWVVMPEHVHLLMRPRDGVVVSRICLSVKHAVSLKVLDRWRTLRAPILNRLMHGTKARFWLKGGGFDRNVRNELACVRTVRYIHRNPVTRGLVVDPTGWKWSSARGWNGCVEGHQPLLPLDALPIDYIAGWNGWD